MKLLPAISLAVVALAAASAFAQSDIYRWVDKDGKVHFSDAPPPEDATQVTQKRAGGGEVDVSQLPYATQIASQRYPVTIFTTSNCGDTCADARTLLASRGIPYKERDAGVVEEAKSLRALVGAAVVPVLQVGDTTVKGFIESDWNSALDTAGYLRTLPPGYVAPKPPPQASAPLPTPPQPAPAPTPEAK